MRVSPRIAIVIPILDEATTLPLLLAGIGEQTLAPSEVIIVDAGSTDDSIAIVKKWAADTFLGEERVQVIVNPGGMPGANRNRGVAAAKSDWIAFIDAGIVPATDWLARLWVCVELNRKKAAFGRCHFDAESAFEKAVCALSYGVGTLLPALPASIFHRSVFEEVGYFREELRAAEDLVWMKALDRIYGNRLICDEARVYYRHFPKNAAAVRRKWFMYQSNFTRAGLANTRTWLLPAFFAVVFMSFFVMPLMAVWLLLAYVFARGVLDPMRRSHTIVWWGKHPVAALIALWLAFVIDGAKVLGTLLFPFRR